jgi:hypothetical protein
MLICKHTDTVIEKCPCLKKKNTKTIAYCRPLYEWFTLYFLCCKSWQMKGTASSANPARTSNQIYLLYRIVWLSRIMLLRLRHQERKWCCSGSSHWLTPIDIFWCDSGCDSAPAEKMMRLLAAPAAAPQYWYIISLWFLFMHVKVSPAPFLIIANWVPELATHMATRIGGIYYIMMYQP